MRAAILSLVALLVLFAAPVRGAEPASPFIEDLTWTELRDQIAAGKTTVIIPIGGTEQNGPHMAIGKHNVRVKLLAGKIAAALGNAVVAPVLSYVPEGNLNPPSAHMRWPGTISVPEDSFEKTIEYAARSFKVHGFHDIVFLGDHGSTQKGEQAVAAKLDREWTATPVRVHAIVQYYEEGEGGFGKLLESRGYPASEVGTHAGLADTSLTLALAPELVRKDKLKPGEGVNGDPSRASAELGNLGVDAIVSRTVAAIKSAIARR
jgi:creatinine amidohydrolase/Fe(II)-dependent formamide hydrolase-like protein